MKSASARGSLANESRVGRAGRNRMVSRSRRISSSVTPSNRISFGMRTLWLVLFLKMETVRMRVLLEQINVYIRRSILFYTLRACFLNTRKHEQTECDGGGIFTELRTSLALRRENVDLDASRPDQRGGADSYAKPAANAAFNVLLGRITFSSFSASGL